MNETLYVYLDCDGDKNPDMEAVIAADSACFYQGLIDREPSKVSVCTMRDDRHQMSFPFAIVRHYLSEDYFNTDKKE